MSRIFPVAYFITFSCHGARLHGHPEFSVDRDHSGYKSPPLDPNPDRLQYEREKMQIKDVCLDGHQRDLVLDSIRETCAYREWRLLACHVRTNHVHVVVQARQAPEKVMTDFKAYATRALNRWENQPGRSKRWARHGSTQYLWDERTVATAISYVVDEQGEPMAVFDSRK